MICIVYHNLIIRCHTCFWVYFNVKFKKTRRKLVMLLLLQVKMSAGDEITITDITHPNKLKVCLQQCSSDCELKVNHRAGRA